MKALAILLAACFALATILTTVEGGVTVLFGWISYLNRVLPEVRGDTLNVTTSIVALVLFAAGVHWLGWSGRRGAEPTAIGKPWKVRWTLSIVMLVFLLFSAGIAAIGIVHQTTWLFGDEKPMLGPSLRQWGTASCVESMQRIGIAAPNHDSAMRTLPPGGTFTPEGEMLHSWETYLLDYLGYAESRIDMKRSWCDPVNERVFKTIVLEFINQGFRTIDLEDDRGFALSHYAANSRVMGANTKMKLEDIKDGASNTLLIGEVNAQFKPWGHPINYRDPATGLNRLPSGFGSPSGKRDVLFVMADGSVRNVSDRISPKVLKALSTPNGGEKIEDGEW